MTPSQGPAHFSEHEIERMRTILAQHDSRKAAEQTFDINNPPRTNYIHQHFPKLVYAGPALPAHPPYKRVHGEEEHNAALALGWLNEPAAPAETEEVELDAASAAEAAKIDVQLKKKKAKKAN